MATDPLLMVGLDFIVSRIPTKTDLNKNSASRTVMGGRATMDVWDSSQQICMIITSTTRIVYYNSTIKEAHEGDFIMAGS